MNSQRRFSKHFAEHYAPRMKHRGGTFHAVFRYLERLEREVLIVETGCAREEDSWSGDGLSTVLFDSFVACQGGRVISIDLSPESCQVARRLTSDKTQIVCSDSVAFLAQANFPRAIDLLYLDSFDLDWSNPHPSSMHHLQELCAVFAKLEPGCLIVVDDNARGRGKGAYVRDFFSKLGIRPVFDDYQVGWVLPRSAGSVRTP